MLTFRQINSSQLKCTLDLYKLYSVHNEVKKFQSKFSYFLKADLYNKKIYHHKSNRLIYLSEQLIPSKKDKRPPLLLILGNPASHSVDAGMFFYFEGNGKEHRFWKIIMRGSGLIDFYVDYNLPPDKLINVYKKKLLNLDYKSQFRIGLSVFISMPSGASGKYSGIAGIQKLLGVKALRLLEAEEKKRVIGVAKKFLKSNGAAITFQKNAWNALRSPDDPPYSLGLAKKGKLKGTLSGMPDIRLFGLPPTRLGGLARKVLWKIFSEQICKL